MARLYDGKVSIIGVAGRAGVDEMAEFVQRHDLGHFPQLADTEMVLWDRFEIVGQPAWVFIDADTGETEVILGPLFGEELPRRLDALIASDA